MSEKSTSLGTVGPGLMGAPMAMTAMAAELHRLMIQHGHGDEDGSALARPYREDPL